MTTSPGLIGSRGSASTAEIRSRETSAALTSITTAKTANTWAGPRQASSNPPMNGPTTTPEFSAKEETAFAAVSSSGPSETLGRSAALVGRVNVRLAAATVATTSVSENGASANRAIATRPRAAACAR